MKILVKYICKEICKNQIIILILLFLVCFCQKLIKVLGLLDYFPINFIALYLILNAPELGKLIIPFSLFLSVLMTCYRLHINNEVLAMYACAVSKYIFIKSILLYSIIISLVVAVNIAWLSPYCEQCRNNILLEIKKSAYFIKYIDRKFQLLFNKGLVFFIDSIKDNKLKHVFIVHKKQDNPNNTVSIIIADQGNIQYCDDRTQLIILRLGTYYDIYHNQKVHNNIYITDFYQYQIPLIDYNYKLSHSTNQIIDQMFMNQLWNSEIPEALIEFNWRLTLLVSVFIMPIIALLLMINISTNYSMNFILAMTLYVGFFVFHVVLSSDVILKQTNSIIWIWVVNFIYLMIILIINLWQNTRLKYLP